METDQELIDRVKEDQDSNSLVEIIERHSGVYHDMVDRFLSGSRNTAERDSLLRIKSLQYTTR